MSNQSDEKMVVRTTVLHSAHLEMQRQQRLKAEGRFKFTCRDPEMSHPERLTVLMEEVGEVARAILEGAGLANDLHEVNLRKELIQVAAVALSWAEGMDERDDERDAQLVFPDVSPPTVRGVTGQVFADLVDDLPHFADTGVMRGHAEECIKGAGHMGPCSISTRRVGPLAGERLHDWHEVSGEKIWEEIEAEIAKPDAPAPRSRTGPLADVVEGVPIVYVDGSKYIFYIPKDDYKVHVLRGGDPWLVIASGSKAICAMMNEHDDYRQRAFRAARQLEALATAARKVQQPLSHVVMCACLTNQGYLCGPCRTAIWDQMNLSAPRSR